jgi:hypoxanthine phosphoribosyltransferase
MTGEGVPRATVRKLFTEREIAGRVEGLAHDIAANLPPDFIIVGLLTGCFVFVADLIRALDRSGVRPQVSFIRLSSYGKGKESSRLVRLTGDIPELAGRNVLLVDDIVDTGRTQLFARSLLREQGAAQVWACALLEKPSRREVEVTTEFVGFSIPDVFVVGYGIDYAEQYRHLPYIGAVE